MSPNYKSIIEETTNNNFNVHDKYKDLHVAELSHICSKEKLPFSVCALNLTGDLNIGMMMRTASIMGADEFIICGRKKYDRRSTVGAQNYLTISYIDALEDDGVTFNSNKFFEYMKENYYVPVFIECNGTPLHEIDWSIIEDFCENYRICFVFGNESHGIPIDFLQEDSYIISIPQRGVLRSLNVSSATSIVLWDYVKYLLTK